MIWINNNHRISNFVISSALGTSGTGIPIYKVFYDYLFLLSLVLQTKTTIITKSLTYKKHIGKVLPFSLLNPFPFIFSAFKYIKRIPGNGLVNCYQLTNAGIEIESLKILQGFRKGFEIIPSLYGNMSKLELQKSLIVLERTLGDYFFALEIGFCPNVYSAMEFEEVCEKIHLIKSLYPNLFLIIKLNYPWEPKDFAQNFEKAGADCFHAINAISWSDIFPEKKSPLPSDCPGSVSGPPIATRALNFNRKLKMETGLPTIGEGGLWTITSVNRMLTYTNSASGCTNVTDNTRETIKIIQTLNY